MFHNVIRILADHCSCASFNDKHVERNPATVPVKSKDAKNEDQYQCESLILLHIFVFNDQSISIATTFSRNYVHLKLS